MPKTYYVSANTGNDSNDGLSENAAFKSLQTGADRLEPGDTLYVMNGTYTQSDPSKDLLSVWKKNGSEDKWTSIKAYPGHTPKLKVKGAFGINIAGSSYLLIEGLEIEGSKNEVTLDYAQQEQYNPKNPITNSIGIVIHGRSDMGDSDHIVIRDNKVRDFTAGGITADHADYITIEKNVVSGNAWYTPKGMSGIGVIWNRNSDNNTSDYKMVIKDNIVYDNQSLIPWSGSGKITEGHGVMLDTGDGKDQAQGHGEAYQGKTLVANNTVYNNGGFGIQAYHYLNADIINNTTYQNSRHPDLSGEIAVIHSKNVRGYNNIMYARSDRRANHIYDSKNVTFDDNLAYNSSEFVASDNPNAEGLENILGYDPEFVDPSGRDFTLKSTSPAIDAGSGAFNSVTALNKDQQGKDRPQDGDGNGSAIADIGALEVAASNSSDNSEVKGVSKTSPVPGETNNDKLVTTPETDKILTQQAKNPLKRDVDADILIGGSDADKFLYAGRNQQETFAQSTVDAPDQITNFNPIEGDRIQLDKDGKLSTKEGLKGANLYNAGLVKGNNLSAAIQAAYNDKDQQTQGDQVLNQDESVLFKWRDGTYLAMNDQNKSFDPNTDFVLNVTGIQIPGKDIVAGVLQAKNYFC
ncbi:right-handed parallel beta-helix repeat-containing protein [Fischerella sp. JS2]|uniref:right-handed parallel beta-helix repeat-containing protein n=1 Tax=Fischerella sp. JS2 TaxID=2597771 RepID=UPI0028E5EFAA|nr:right-handed parallel beta-helix repeat-containing protein [Fischerella sp. JS2]